MALLRRSLTALRAVFNTVFVVVWTIGMVTGVAVLAALARDRQVFVRAQRTWARGLVWGCGATFRVCGADALDPSAAYVLVVNHESPCDIVALFAALPAMPAFVAKRELLRVPFVAAALRLGGHVLVSRGQRGQAHEALQEAGRCLASGRSVVFFPEGTRGDGVTLLPFKSGGFRLAKDARASVLPIGLRGTASILGKGNPLVWPGTVEVHVGTPIPAAEVEARDAGELAEITRTAVTRLLGR
ncbi:MAG: lysophospholipid acyltransferase family protein [Vicinamibacterales bacterium]